MSSVEKRVRNGRVTWLARWRDPDGRQRKRTFTKRSDADRFVTTVAADVLRGDYLDPDAGRETFRTYAERWLKAQAFDPSTREQVALRLRLHAYPTLGGMQLRRVQPSTVQGWVRGLGATLAPRTVKGVFVHVSAVFAAAVDDELLRRNPCRAPTVKAPRPDVRKVTPWPAETVVAVQDALPERYRIVATIAAGLGVRQGEVFGLAPGDVDFLRGWVTVQRQVKLVASRLVFALPKYRKVRKVPLPSSVRDKLAAYLAAFPAREVTLPWGDVDGKPTAVDLVVTSRECGALNRSYFNPGVWKKALADAGVEPTRENGCHALRHFYASVLLDGGESIKAVSEYLGHADAGFTLRTYTHLLPASEERTRRAVDAVLGESRAPVVPQAVE